jgi:hypothetical protein
VEIAKAYRPVARQRGYLKTLAEKMRENPNVARFFGAADFKPFAFTRYAPNTRWNQTDRERLSIRFTFQECAELAEHFAKDLGIDRALLVLNGWINGGYDNRHPISCPPRPKSVATRGSSSARSASTRSDRAGSSAFTTTTRISIKTPRRGTKTTS